MVWLHGHGNVFLVTLDAGEQIDVEAGAWLYKDPTVKLEAMTMGLKSGIFGGGGKLTWNRFTGPGRLAIQTMFIAPAEGEGAAGCNAERGGDGRHRGRPHRRLDRQLRSEVWNAAGHRRRCA